MIISSLHLSFLSSLLERQDSITKLLKGERGLLSMVFILNKTHTINYTKDNSY